MNYDSLQFLFSENNTTQFLDETIFFHIVQKFCIYKYQPP